MNLLGDSALNATRRARDLERLEAGGPVDLLVVGGGVTGAGVALDAASRGLSVVLAEKHDLAFGTSRWSSKLVHGGLRGQGRDRARERGGARHPDAAHRAAPGAPGPDRCAVVAEGKHQPGGPAARGLRGR